MWKLGLLLEWSWERGNSVKNYVSFAVLLLALGTPAEANTFQVNTTTDLIDTSPGDSQCLTVENSCSLRVAVMEANALPGSHSVVLPAGTYVLTLPGSGGASEGDLDISELSRFWAAGCRRPLWMATCNSESST